VVESVVGRGNVVEHLLDLLLFGLLLVIWFHIAVVLLIVFTHIAL
jgi:hypothetical protein